MLGQEIGRALVVGFGQGAVEGVQHQGQIAFGGRGDQHVRGLDAFVLGAAQQGFDPHRLVEQVGAGLAFEAGEAVQIEDVAGAAEVLQVGELQGRDPHLVGSGFELLGRQLGPQPRLLQPFAGLVRGHGDQVVQLQHPALAGLEGPPVGPVHGAEADVLQLALGGVVRPVRGPEHLLEVVRLTLVDAIEHQLRIEAAPPVEHRRQVGGAIHGRAFG